MSALAFALVITSAFCHAAWNYVGKKSEPSLAFFTLASIFASLILLPYAVLESHLVWDIFSAYWPYVAATGFFQAFYFLGLTFAYRSEDLSIVYPIARALPVGLVPVWLAIFDSKHYSLSQYLGVIAIILGSLVIPHASLKRISMSALLNKGSFYALVAALATTGYTLIDQHVLSSVSMQAADYESWQISLSYMFLLSASSVVFVLMLSMIAPVERQHWRTALQAQTRSAFSTAIIMTLTYSLVLIAMNFADNVGYIVALRQLSIPIGVLLGVFLLGERFAITQKFALATIMVGIYTVLFIV